MVTRCSHFSLSDLLLWRLCMAQIDKIATVLADCSKNFGVTASMIAKKTHIPRGNVRKRIHDLRNEGYSIHTNFRKINGVRKAYYLMSSVD